MGSIASASEGELIPYYENPGAFVKDKTMVIESQNICEVSEVALLGKHNWQNICAAVTAVWQVTQNMKAIRSVIKSFKGMEHRLEFVREIDGVSYYDDSFGTTPETAIVAIEAFDQPKIVILGGSDKGSKYTKLAKAVSNNNVKKVLLIGQMAAAIKSELDKVGFADYIDGGSSMKEMIDIARKNASKDDVVLLSTGCASFDMFKNYKDRGEQFKKSVQAL
jgi:UDP-N-acetylmuramoylalanine--D-glutamate ligase